MPIPGPRGWRDTRTLAKASRCSRFTLIPIDERTIVDTRAVVLETPRIVVGPHGGDGNCGRPKRGRVGFMPEDKWQIRKRQRRHDAAK